MNGLGFSGQREVLVHDYVDGAVSALRRMSEKHIRGYESLGYTVERPSGQADPESEGNDAPYGEIGLLSNVGGRGQGRLAPAIAGCNQRFYIRVVEHRSRVVEIV